MKPDDHCYAESIRDILQSRPINSLEQENPDYRQAAVLIPLFVNDGQCQVLFTKRTEDLSHHKGQISFPGGAKEENDRSAEMTALRETHEEIGLLPEDVLVLGPVDDALTVISRFIVHPFVARIPFPYPFVINRAEVEKLIIVPLAAFHPNKSTYKRTSVQRDGVTYETVAYEYNGDLIWGATARMMENFTNILGDNFPLPE
jgi:8-oxo-dGTP pyrophosphatase MutT (NUDIX family)